MTMQVKLLTEETVESLVEMRKTQGVLRFPNEYQRGAAWKKPQKQLFADSVFRGYSIPVFYFHLRGEWKSAATQEIQKQYAVIDGQQRIRALHEFIAGAFKLPDSSGFKFPAIAGESSRPWEGKGFAELHGDLEEIKKEFLTQPVIIYEIITSDENEVRDLFIRLQGGTPLTAQDKRDAWPGKFTEFVLNIGGKESNDDDDVGYTGHDFFEKYVRGKGGAKRQTAAQVAMLLLNRWDEDAGKFREFRSVDSHNLDEFYRRNVAFDANGENARKFRRTLDKIVSAFGQPPKNKLAVHEAIHMALLVDSLMDGYASGWESALYPRFTRFREQLDAARKAQKAGQSPETPHEDEYGRWTGQNASDASTIQRRHAFFFSEMRDLLSPIPLNVGPRQIDALAKDVVYIRDGGRCQWCEMRGIPHTVEWAEAQFHHVIQYKEGGLTNKENSALVAAKCHPIAAEDVETFRRWWQEEKPLAESIGKKKASKGRVLPPDGTRCKFRAYEGEIVRRKLVVNDARYDSFSGACTALAGKAMNGWGHWKIRLPNADEWMLAMDWREQLDRNLTGKGMSFPQTGVAHVEED